MPDPRTLAIAALCLLGCDSDRGPSAALTGEIETVEATTESFANALLDLSIEFRRLNEPAVRRFFADRVTWNGLPEPDGGSVTQWTRSTEWTTSRDVREWTGADVVRGLFDLVLDHTEVEDVRFKVASSTVRGQTVDAKLKFFIVGRDGERKRRWLRGKAEAHGARNGEQWQLSKLVFTELSTMRAPFDLFDEVAAPAGIAEDADPLAARTDEPFAAYGAAVGDLNLDGFVDLIATGAKRNALYLNRGDGTFDDVAATARISVLPHTVTAPLLLDIDDDGDLDLFLAAIGDQFLFENRLVPDGELEYRDVSQSAGVARPAIGFSAVAGDVNRDGRPDIYVASYQRYGEILPDSWDGAANGTPNLLFVSDGDGSYTESAAKWGVDDRRWSYAAGFADVDEDGDLDLYVANDYGGGNRLYIREGDRFADEAAARGVADGGYGMGVSFADFDNDGHLDLHVTRMSSTAGRRILSRLSGDELPARNRLEAMAVGNALYRNSGNGTFEDVTATAGPVSAGWAWGGGFFDFDNDGHEDLYSPNGFISGRSLKDT